MMSVIGKDCIASALVACLSISKIHLQEGEISIACQCTGQLQTSGEADIMYL